MDVDVGVDLEVLLSCVSRTFVFAAVLRRLESIKESTARGTTDEACPHVERCILMIMIKQWTVNRGSRDE